MSATPVAHPEHDARALDDAIMRMTIMVDRHPNLARAQTTARLRLAETIIRRDEKQDAGEPTIAEQIAVAEATAAYVRALTALLRGDDSRA